MIVCLADWLAGLFDWHCAKTNTKHENTITLFILNDSNILFIKRASILYEKKKRPGQVNTTPEPEV